MFETILYYPVAKVFSSTPSTAKLDMVTLLNEQGFLRFSCQLLHAIISPESRIIASVSMNVAEAYYCSGTPACALIPYPPSS